MGATNKKQDAKTLFSGFNTGLFGSRRPIFKDHKKQPKTTKNGTVNLTMPDNFGGPSLLQKSSQVDGALLTLPVMDFIGRVITHIHDRNFRSIRYF